MTFKPFDVVTFAFPYVEKAGFVKRPAVILSDSEQFGTSTGVSIVAMITSAKQSEWPLDIRISDLASAGLSVPCFIRFKLNSAAHELFDRQIGALERPDREAVGISLRRLFPFL